MGSKCWKNIELYYVINERCGFYSWQWSDLIFFWMKGLILNQHGGLYLPKFIFFILIINFSFLLLATNLFFPTFAFYFLNQNLCYIYLCEYLAACVSLYHVCAWCPWRPEEGVGSFGTVVVVLSCSARAGSWTWILCKSNQKHLTGSLRSPGWPETNVVD